MLIAPAQEGSKMTADGMEQCFDSIERVQDFMRVLAETVLESANRKRWSLGGGDVLVFPRTRWP